MKVQYLFRAAFFILITLQLFSCSKETTPRTDTESIGIKPKIVQNIDVVNSVDSETVKDLSEIVVALEKYKVKNKMYPISKNNGKDWNRYIYDESGSIDESWISGLAPNHIEKIPHDRRKNSTWGTQYAYKSNGAHYKLISLLPKDCELVKLKMPDMIDTKREKCIAYGFWTEGAKNW